MTNYRDKMFLYNELLETLDEAQGHRSERETFDGKEFAWNSFEKETMLESVNKWRFVMGKTPVTMQEINKVESTASGHVDYSRKFALYCAELVLAD